MSADNYMLIRTLPTGGYVVTMEFASDDKPGPVDHPTARRFDTLQEAEDYAYGVPTEYGVKDDLWGGEDGETRGREAE